MAASASLPSPSDVSGTVESGEWSASAERPKVGERGGLVFGMAVVFLALYYVRPQDWVPGMAGVNVMRPVMLIWCGLLFTQASKSPLQGLLRTPHDWAMLCFWAFVVVTAPPEAGAGMGMFSLVIFYYLTTQSLTSWDAVLGYLKAWNACLLIIAGFGVLQVFGFDITAGKGYTETFFGRLSLGTWIANNPNALGHTIMPAIPLSYMLYFWRGGATGRLLVFPACVALVGLCAWETQSKGSFLVGAGLTVLLFVVGRPKWVQLVVIGLALSLGVGALSFLPRMEDMNDLSSDEGVQGRLMAWEMAKTARDSSFSGVGWKQFLALIDWSNGVRTIYGIRKSTHSSYVQVGADLGRVGLFLWLLCLWVAVRTTLILKAENPVEERCRRAAFMLIAAYLASSWMINRQYHTEYFLIIALAAAIQRLAVGRSLLAGQPSLEVPGDESLPNDWTSGSDLRLNPRPSKKPFWNRLSWFDLVMGIAITGAVISLWDYILKVL
jgi:hypothetical protein